MGDGHQGRPTQVAYGGPGDGEYHRFQPGAGVAIGYDDSKVIELARLMQSIALGKPIGATIEDALWASRANEAVVASASSRNWERLT